MRFRRVLIIVASMLVLGALFAGGCWLEIHPWHHHAGYAVLRWTIDGHADPSACVERGAQRVEIRAIDAWGDLRAVATPRCDAFEETLALDDGWYQAQLTMVDTSRRPVANTVTTDTFRVVSRESIVITVDWSRNATEQDTATAARVR